MLVQLVHRWLPSLDDLLKLFFALSIIVYINIISAVLLLNLFFLLIGSNFRRSTYLYFFFLFTMIMIFEAGVNFICGAIGLHGQRWWLRDDENRYLFRDSVCQFDNIVHFLQVLLLI